MGGKGFLYGNSGGTSLNFKVVGNPQPTSPKENTVWVNTDTAISGWVFSAAEPTNPVKGMVWFHTGANSSTPINALKKNGIYVYPDACQQYINGAWVGKVALVYQNGMWLGWELYLFQNGDEKASVTGGWAAQGLTISGGSYATAPSITNDGTTILFTESAGSNGGVAYMKNKINLSGYNTLTMKIRTNAVSAGVHAGFYIWETIGTSYIAKKDLNLNNNGSGNYATVTVDVTNYNGSYYLGFGFCAYDVLIELRMPEMKLEV